jgi:hypothetical protein
MWTTPLPAGKSVTMTVMGNQIVAIVAPGKLVVLDAATGKSIRQLDLQ